MYKILLTNNSLSHCTGTETWTYAMAEELQRQGHDVTVFTKNKGSFAEHFNCPVITNYSGAFDFAIVNHTTTYKELPDELFKIFTSHSSVFDIEKPPQGSNYVCVNERVGKPVIRNGVDLKRFKFAPITKEKPKVLYLSNPAYSGGRDFVKQAIPDAIMLDSQVFKIEDYIYMADIVISMSRGAIEAMACGRNVIYGDWRRDWSSSFMGYGMITGENMDDFITGQAFNKLKEFTPENLRNEVEKYSQGRGWTMRAFAETYFDIKKTSKKYIGYYESNR